jgi:hypothetical protein
MSHVRPHGRSNGLTVNVFIEISSVTCRFLMVAGEAKMCEAYFMA